VPCAVSRHSPCQSAVPELPHQDAQGEREHNKRGNRVEPGADVLNHYDSRVRRKLGRDQERGGRKRERAGKQGVERSALQNGNQHRNSAKAPASGWTAGAKVSLS
jgi:hypothetical protein